MSRNKQSRKYSIGRSYLVTVYIIVGHEIITQIALTENNPHALRASCPTKYFVFLISSYVDTTVYQHGKCSIFLT